ncbi:hypothetical protein N8H74_12120 [Pseudomonas sp. B2M1-30]|uniref:hypothetical protein n=1 Tax=Pseudomonas TaxID=286 RepID=UPI0021C95B49|nr:MULTISPECIES: hypothetical protein [Pseudomonas]MCU0119002.1 hypothetical protein [Pseudomonas sp. B2M1-30]MCU7263961.1 hypothetical protein [Pseudomonas koreensis]
MALIECYECKRSISSEASACIHCGAPMAEQQTQAAPVAAKSSTISFGSLPRNSAVPEAVAATPAPAPLPKVMPAAAGRRRRQQAEQTVEPQVNVDGSRPVEGWLKIMVFLMPMIFVWFLLRGGHSAKQRLFGFGWLALLILASSLSPK